MIQTVTRENGRESGQICEKYWLARRQTREEAKSEDKSRMGGVQLYSNSFCCHLWKKRRVERTERLGKIAQIINNETIKENNRGEGELILTKGIPYSCEVYG